MKMVYFLDTTQVLTLVSHPMGEMGHSKHHHAVFYGSSRNVLVSQAGTADMNESRNLLEGQLLCFGTGKGVCRSKAHKSTW